MSLDWIRRALMTLAAGATLALAGCGSGTIESQFHPTRLVAFGDAFTDAGQRTGARYSVNDGSINNWAVYVAAQYGLALNPSSAGGTNYAWGSARITQQPDAGGDATTPTVQQQVSSFLAASTPAPTDLFFLGAGTADLVAEIQKVLGGQQTSDQMLANVAQAAHDMAAQALRLKAAGATHVVLVPPYDMSKSSWATQTGQQALMAAATTKFTTTLLVDLVNEGQDMLYVDTAFIVNLLYGSPGSYGIVDVNNPVCTSVDAGQGIGTGAGQINSSLCSVATLAAATPATFLFADRVYLTPVGNQQLGNYVYSRVISRW